MLANIFSLQMTNANKKMKMSSMEQKTSCQHSSKYYTIVMLRLSEKKKVFWKYFTIVFLSVKTSYGNKEKKQKKLILSHATSPTWVCGLRLEGTRSPHHSDSVIQADGSSNSAHTSMLTSAGRRMHTGQEGYSSK